MTVISTVISKICTVHASDSLIMGREKYSSIYDKVIEDKKSKIIPVKRWSGAISYWGAAILNNGQSIKDWLEEQVKDADNYDYPQNFANELAYRITKIIPNPKKLKSPLGIHFTAYEKVGDYMVPELFKISNFRDYKGVFRYFSKATFSRETYQNIFCPPLYYRRNHRERIFRERVYQYLQGQDEIFVYNNGDNAAFNKALSTILSILKFSHQQKILKNPNSIQTFRAIATKPIEIIANDQHQNRPKGQRLVGGNIHYMVITEDGKYDVGYKEPTYAQS